MKRYLIISAVVMMCAGCGANAPAGKLGTVRAYTAWGDSLTVGENGYANKGSYPSDLQSDLGAVGLVENEGVGSQTSLAIGVREGGILTTATIVGGEIPDSGPVGIAFPAGYSPVTNSAYSVAGTIAGVHGVVSLRNGALIFTRTSTGDTVAVSDAERFSVDTPYVGGGFVPIFWEGRDDPVWDPTAIVDNISKQVTAAHSTAYLVMAIINGNYPGEQKGGPGYERILEINDALANAFAGHYLDIREALVAQYDQSSAIDSADFENDEPPTSVRAVQCSGTLTADVGAADSTFEAAITGGTMVSGQLLDLGSGANGEATRIVSASGNKVTVTRGANPQAHAAGTPIACTDQIHLNAKGYQEVAQKVHDYFGK